ncbi:tetratricopeptide repeat protein [Spirochaeta africana]|uniref:Tfp pilus assembly protein PilF n=1 Tax=Spirochaeta africana (strain ATCC 700263 / DSM 8902 / Z-7692) TaxID=889378 RepID=H9UJ69_SPIAZ|nr:tetratricopeptide repeat protein [Spirochaeta africana]AFG37562.1 Tfp pilus assembly protein PilF [Spirochaeta africana DSM 8902]
MKYTRNRFQSKSKRAASFRYLAPIIVLTLGVGVVAWLLYNTSFSLSSFGLSRDKEQIIALWHDHEFAAAYDHSQTALSQTPLDTDYLVLNGFAGFYHGIEQPDQSDAHLVLEQSVQSLRRAVLLTPSQYHPELHYVLGKAYFHRGQFYYDAAIRHLTQAHELDYAADDLFEYIGLAATRLEQFDTGVTWLTKALEKRFTPLLSLNLAEALFQAGRYTEAVTYAEQTVAAADDQLLITEASLLVGKSRLEQEDFDGAIRHFSDMIAEGKDVAEVRYWLGETYYQKGEPIQARAEWREAVRLDSQHAPAAERLQG